MGASCFINSLIEFDPSITSIRGPNNLSLSLEEQIIFVHNKTKLIPFLKGQW